jgi:hypothetical protein
LRLLYRQGASRRTSGIALVQRSWGEYNIQEDYAIEGRQEKGRPLARSICDAQIQTVYRNTILFARCFIHQQQELAKNKERESTNKAQTHFRFLFKFYIYPFLLQSM